jgi:hypothetical protein
MIQHSLDTTTRSATDEQFYRSTADLFPPAFLGGAGALLATYDAAHSGVTGPVAP